MSHPNDSDNKRVLYLQQIDINTHSRTRFSVKLKIDNKDVEIQQVGTTPTWTPPLSLELSDTSNIALSARSTFFPFAKTEELAEVSGDEAFKAFWQSTDSISRTTTFDERPTTITFRFRPSQTSETIRAAFKKLETAMESYRSLMTGQTEQCIDTVIKYGVALSEINPFAKVAFSLAKITFNLLKEQRKYDEMVANLASGIARVLPFATQSLEDVPYDETELLDGAIRDMLELVVSTAEFVVGYAKRSPASRVAKSTISLSDYKKIEALQCAFAKLKEDFDRAVDVAALKMARRNEEFRLLDRLKPTDAANYEESYGCMEGTRTAVLTDIITWVPKIFDHTTQLADSNTHNIFWLYGIPGLGKTSVANSLCERLRRSGNLGGCFFCRRDDPILREPKRVLPTLISKLVEMWAPYRKVVAQALHDDPQLNPESTGGELLLKSLHLLKRHPPRILVLVIDALDECGQSATRRPLLHCLMEACSLVYWLKVIITSRPEHDLKSFFDKRDITSRDLATDDPAGTDIRHFTRGRMASIASHRHLRPDWPGERCITQIVQRSGGLFIFVETVYRLVDDPDPKSLLARVLGGELEGANAELHKLYSMAIISRISQQTEAIRSILQAIVAVATYRPLRDDTLANLIGLDPPVVCSWVDDLSSLLYRDASQKGGIRVRHSSILEFLVGPSCPREFRVDLKRANAELGLHCLRIMVKELKFNICKLETSCLSNVEIQGLEIRVAQRIPDALLYSCMHWSSHLCFDMWMSSKDLSELLEYSFAGPRPLYWLEVLSLMGKVPAAILALRQIRACTKNLEEHHLHLVDDILRFVLAFYTPISTSAPHTYVSALSFMPTGSRLWDHARKLFPNLVRVCRGRVQSWPALPGVWRGHKDHVRSVACSRDGRYVASGSGDRTIRIWDAETGAVVGEPLREHTGSVNSVAYSPDGRHLISGSNDKTIRIWDAETGVAVGEPLKGHSGSVRSVAYSPDGQHIVSGSNDRTIRVWDVATGVGVGEPLRGHSLSVRSVAYSPDGWHVVSGSSDRTIRIWDVKAGEAVGEPLKGHTDYIWSVAYSPDGRHIISGSDDRTIRMWNAETGLAVGGPLKGHTGSVWTVTYSPDCRRIISGSSDMTIRIWDAETRGAVGEPLKGHTAYVNSITYSPDGRHAVSGSDDGEIRIWDAETGAAMGESLEVDIGTVRCVAYSPDGRHVVSASDNGTIQIWDAETGATVGHPLRGHTLLVWSVAYSPDGLHIVSGSNDKTIRIWDAATGAVVGEPLRGHGETVTSVAYSPDGRHIVSGSLDKTIRIWDVKAGEAVGGPLKGHTDYIWSVAYSPDGLKIVSGSDDSTIQIWDTKTGLAVGKPLKGHTGTVASVKYSPGGRHIVSGSSDKTIRIWDAAIGATVGEPLEGHTETVTSVAYSPDGQCLVSGSSDRTIRIWDAETGAAVGEPLKGHTGGIKSVAYSPDSRHVVSGAYDGTIRIWDVVRALESDGRGVLPGSSDPSGGYPSLTTFSTLPLNTDMLDSNGWIRGAEGLLLWVPEDCRQGLTCQATLTIPNTGRQRCVRLDFQHFQYGNSWASIRGRAT